MQLQHYISYHTQLSEKAVQNTLTLLNDDCSIPFIARYRKEQTGNLDEIEIGDILKFKEIYDALEKRKKTILKSLEEQGVLSTELHQKITETKELIALEDLYLPFKKKRKTKAEVARKQGLEPLAKMLMSQRLHDCNQAASKYTSNEIPQPEQALEGARHIIAEWINERTDIRSIIRSQLARFATISTKVIATKSTDEKAQKFQQYFEWSEALKSIPSHRLLAILRAEEAGYIRVKIQIDSERTTAKIAQRIIRSQNACTIHLEQAVKDAYKRLLYPSLSNEALTIAKEKADTDAIAVFANNLQQLLLAAPLGEKCILGIDPGYRTGCKVVCLNRQGDLVHNETIFPHAPQNKYNEAIKKISALTNAYAIEAIAIGNGTASRETAQLIRKIPFQKDIEVFVVNEAGASIYSASKIARDEFPNYDITVRGAVSIGRRLADPLAELVKIEAKSIGVGQYQHDVDQTKLKKSLDTVVESCVHKVGVNINTASVPLLSYVSGIGTKIAENIVKYRNENGVFTSRAAIKKVPRMGNKSFEQAAGFLRIKNAKNPLDNSAVHPESYGLVSKMAKDLNTNVAELIGNKSMLTQIELKRYTSSTIGLPTLQDIVNELEKPGLDPRKKAKMFAFNQNLKTIADVQKGQLLPGIVNNITNFGCFVDIGIKESGLIHVSNLSDSFVKDVNKIVHLNQQILVTVLDVDTSRKRIQLSLKK